MKINIIGKCDKIIKDTIINSVKKTIEFLGQPTNLELSIKMVSEPEIKELNATTRKIDKVTDVLSFPSINLKAGEKLNNEQLKISSFDEKNIYIGDCALCLSVALKQSVEFSGTLEQEVAKLVTHSVLHLLGYDHISDEDYIIMHKIETELLGEY